MFEYKRIQWMKCKRESTTSLLMSHKNQRGIIVFELPFDSVHYRTLPAIALVSRHHSLPDFASCCRTLPVIDPPCNKLKRGFDQVMYHRQYYFVGHSFAIEYVDNTCYFPSNNFYETYLNNATSQTILRHS